MSQLIVGAFGIPDPHAIQIGPSPNAQFDRATGSLVLLPHEFHHLSGITFAPFDSCRVGSADGEKIVEMRRVLFAVI